MSADLGDIMEQVQTAKIAVSAAVYAIDKPYSYRITPAFAEKIRPGMRVTVPFGRGNRHVEGVVLATGWEPEGEKLKSIEALLDQTPVIEPWQLKLALWMRDRFFCTVYEAVKAMLPAGMWFKDGKRRVNDKTVDMVSLLIPGEEALSLAEKKAGRAPAQAEILRLLAQIGEGSIPEIAYFTGASRSSFNALVKSGVLELTRREVFRRPEIRVSDVPAPIVLNSQQQAVYDDLLPVLQGGRPEAALLYGVTGSGKTSIYIRLVEQVLRMGRSAIILVPEIALTPQLMSLFASYFSDNVAVLHSSLGIGERYDEFKRIREGRVHVVVGTRSAVFAPVRDLGLLIMDEEHERTYKSENAPRYHARDIAKYRCAHENALLLLGSATPSVDSMAAARSGRYRLYSLSTRFNERAMPSVLIADMREDLKAGLDGTVGTVLRQELEKNLAAGEQSILFLNRRGANSLVACGVCGYTYTCPKCSVSLTYHSANRRLMCHYCGYSRPVDEHCPECGGALRFLGSGTQKVQQELEELFPGVGVVRMDADTVSLAHSHQKLLDTFRDERVPILLGTQMVTKGLDFENVTLVGVLNADSGLYLNDYRAAERTFSLITQVVGRSGRGVKPGRAVIQTLSPDNDVIRLASRQDYDGFYQREILMRRLAGTPPVHELFCLTAAGENEASVLRMCAKLRDALTRYLADVPDLSVLGPAQAPILKINNRFRYRVIVSCANTQRVRDTLSHVVRQAARDSSLRGVSVYVDVDPEE